DAIAGQRGVHLKAKLQAIAVESVVADGLAGVVQRRVVDEVRQHIQIGGVVHQVNPDGAGAGLSFNIVAGKDAAAQVPILGAAIDRNGTRRWQDADAEILSRRGGQGSNRKKSQNESY